MLKVLHFQLESVLSGAQRVSAQEIMFYGGEIEYYLACREHGPLTDYLNTNTKDFLLIDSLKNRPALIDIVNIARVVKFCKRHGIDIIHSHSSKPGLIARLAGLFLDCKTVHTIHGFGFGNRDWITKLFIFLAEFLCARLVDHVIVMSDADYKFCKRWLLIGPEKLTLLMNAPSVEVNKCQVINYEKSVSSKLKFLSVARLEQQKDPIGLLKFHHHFFSDSRLDIVGDGQLYDAARRLAASSVVFHGWLDCPQKNYENCDVFVSTSAYEGNPISVIDALAHGKFCILSDIGGHQAFFRLFPDSTMKIEDFCLDEFFNRFGDHDPKKVAHAAEKAFSIGARMIKVREIYAKVRVC